MEKTAEAETSHETVLNAGLGCITEKNDFSQKNRNLNEFILIKALKPAF